ncbi:hypothetical protein CDL60_28530 [Roseateles noduli]|nr:hypothetical protein CDL60_28530 [Roseateles noduli]
MSIDMAYDAMGNRINLRTHTNVPTMADPTVDVPKDSDLWFTYDSMNRQTGAGLLRTANSDGTFRYDFNVKLNGIEIIPGVSGHKITYDLNGNRASDTYLGTKVRLVDGTAPTYYEEDGQLYELTPGTAPRYEVQPMPMSWEVVETYSYDALGRLTGALRDGMAIDQRLYDRAGRVVVQGPQGLSKSYGEAINKNVAASDAYGQEYRISLYDSNGRLLRQQALDSEQREITSDTKYTLYDKAGNVGAYTLRVPGNNGYTNTYVYSRERFDGYKEKSVHATSTKFEEGQTDSFYDVNGSLIRIDDHRKNENDRTFVNDLAGHALYVKQGDAIQRQVVVNGEVLGRYGVGVNEKNPKDKDGNPNFIELADFTSGYQPITGSYPSASVGSYQVRSGDTLRSIARQSYGDEGLWYRIAETNGLSGDRDLRVGQTITIPSAVGTIRNNAGTFQPYDPSKITGDTMPHMPTPPGGGGGCGALGMLLVIVVAVVVTVFTAGAAALAMSGGLSALGSAGIGGIMSAGATALAGGGVIAGASAVAGMEISAAAAIGGALIGGAVGSIASQGVGMAIGIQDKFSWKQVGLSAIGSAVTAGAGPSMSGLLSGSTRVASAVVRAAVSNAVTQGIGVATGLQDKFNWRGVAASAAGSFVAQGLTDAVMGEEIVGPARNGGSLGRVGGMVGALGGGEAAVIAGSTVLGVAAGTTAAIARGGKFSIQQIAVDAFGNALADGIVRAASDDGGSRWGEDDTEMKRLQARYPATFSDDVQKRTAESRSKLPEWAGGEGSGSPASPTSGWELGESALGGFRPDRVESVRTERYAQGPYLPIQQGVYNYESKVNKYGVWQAAWNNYPSNVVLTDALGQTILPTAFYTNKESMARAAEGAMAHRLAQEQAARTPVARPESFLGSYVSTWKEAGSSAWSGVKNFAYDAWSGNPRWAEAGIEGRSALFRDSDRMGFGKALLLRGVESTLAPWQLLGSLSGSTVGTAVDLSRGDFVGAGRNLAVASMDTVAIGAMILGGRAGVAGRTSFTAAERIAVADGFASLGMPSEVSIGNMEIASAGKGSFVPLQPESSLTAGQAGIHAQLPKPGSSNVFQGEKILMEDLRAIGQVTGDEYNLFHKEGQSLVIRGNGSSIEVSPEMYGDLLDGVYGRFEAHTHPPGYSIDPGPADRPFLAKMRQEYSEIWGDDGVYIFGQHGIADDLRIQSELNSKMWRHLYGG